MKRLVQSKHYLPYDPKLISHARSLRRNMTPAEKKIWYGYLNRFPYRVLRQRPIDCYIVDFYCQKLRLVIEIDGETHYTNAGKCYDAERTTVLEAYGLKVLRFSNLDVLERFDGVCAILDQWVDELTEE